MQKIVLIFIFLISLTVIQKIAAQPCVADFTVKPKPPSDSIIFTNLSSVSPNMKYYWDFGDGSYSSLVNPTHFYKPGYYKPLLTIRDTTFNCFDTMTYVGNIKIGNPPCDTSFKYSVSGFTLNYSTTNFNQNIQWDFGDGSSAAGMQGSHDYAMIGNYNFCFTVFCSVTDTFKKCVSISIVPNCKALFTPALDTTQKFKLFLINKSTNTSSTKYAWYFGDGGTSTARNPIHKYTDFGAYKICLTVTDRGCTSSYCDSLGLDSSGKLFKSGAYDLVVIDETVFGIPKIIKSDFKIYPNPANTKLTIDISNSTQHYDKLEILNANGQVCILQTIEKGSETLEIDLERFPLGFYLIKLSNDQGYSYMKMMKN